MNLEKLLTLSPKLKTEILQQLNPAELAAVDTYFSAKLENPWYKYQDDPIGFVEEGLGESLWSKQREILLSIRENKRTAVPACHAPGKSHLAARAIAWWISVHPVGTAQVVTTATTFRQVRNITWAQVRRLANRHKLAGTVFSTEWKVGTEIVGYGFSAANSDEAAVQGIHAPHLLVVVDEAGGISHTLGAALEALMTGGHTRLLVLGNPPTDQEGGWFERICGSELYNTISIPASSTPNFTGEEAGTCYSCPLSVPLHKVNTHLVDDNWVNEVTSEFGLGSAFVEARVHARFPRQVANKVIPLSWVEQSIDNTAADLGAIRIGVDVASDGGDEFTIAWAEGMVCTLRHKSSGQANANAVDVAGIVLEQIRQAEQVHKEKNYTSKVRVKVDSIGLGWGVVSTLRTWGTEQLHNADIVAVNVAERARESTRFTNQRAEMWWNGRTLLQPTADGSQVVKIDADHRTLAQLSGPMYASDSSGRIKIESKMDIKRRGITSPDRAEAILLALYEPKKTGLPQGILPFSLTQSNDWGIPKL